MKKFLLILVFLMLISFCGCSLDMLERILPTKPQKSSVDETDLVTEPTTTVPATTVPSTTVPATTVPATTPPEVPKKKEANWDDSAVPYWIRIDRDDFPVWNGPSYNGYIVATVEEAGVYTILEEKWDKEGNLWGRLKSGLGWVDLSLIHSEEYSAPAITVGYASDSLLRSGNYHYCINPDTNSCTASLYIYETVYDVSFYTTMWENGQLGNLVEDKELLHLDSWSPSKPIVADIGFPMDFTTYGIRFTDSMGITHKYEIYESMRNGELMLREANY